MKDLVVTFVDSSSHYGGMRSALHEASNELGFDIKNHHDDLFGYKYIILFENNLKRIKNIKCDKDAVVGWWMNDLRSRVRVNNRNLYNIISYVFLCNTEYLNRYRSQLDANVYYMPQCGYCYGNKDRRTIDWNLLFIGNLVNKRYHWNREKILSELEDFSLKIISRDGQTKDMGSLYRRSPISLSISLPMSEYTSNRLYNILASGGFALSLYYPGMEKQFTNHKDLVWFKTIEEAKDVISYYLRHPEERKRIARNGYLSFSDKHRGSHRVQNMYDIMRGNTKDFYGYT